MDFPESRRVLSVQIQRLNKSANRHAQVVNLLGVRSSGGIARLLCQAMVKFARGIGGARHKKPRNRGNSIVSSPAGRRYYGRNSLVYVRVKSTFASRTRSIEPA